MVEVEFVVLYKDVFVFVEKKDLKMLDSFVTFFRTTVTLLE